MLNARPDIDAGLREALKPAASLKVYDDIYGTSILMGDFDFLLEGVPTIVANQHRPGESWKVAPTFSQELDTVEVQDLKRNTAIAAVMAFGIAERSEPIGPRQSRAEIDALLHATIIADQLKDTGLWYLWESGERGRWP
jgi:hypothetical protein